MDARAHFAEVPNRFPEAAAVAAQSARAGLESGHGCRLVGAQYPDAVAATLGRIGNGHWLRNASIVGSAKGPPSARETSSESVVLVRLLVYSASNAPVLRRIRVLPGPPAIP